MAIMPHRDGFPMAFPHRADGVPPPVLDHRRAPIAVALLALAAAACGAPVAAPPPPTTPPPATSVAPAAAPHADVTGDVAHDLRLPWGIDFLPSGDALVTERDQRRILRITAQGQVSTVGDLPEAGSDDESGVLGLAVSPGFATDSLVYVFLSTGTDNRIERMTFDGTTIGPRQVLASGIPTAVNHDGGILGFGPDGMLYAGTGDATDRQLAQDPASPAGKILRMTPDGQPAPGNPFPGSLVYSLGHRNVEGLAFDSRGRLWASEFGDKAEDELNLIRPGGNYGWPVVEGSSDDPRFVAPMAVWPVADSSPSGIAIVDDVVYMAALRGQRLWRIPITGDSVGTPQAFLQGEHGRLRSVARAPDGSLWIGTSNLDKLGRPGPGDDRVLRVVVG
jgi:glucose/arabinose dehydrogenase